MVLQKFGSIRQPVAITAVLFFLLTYAGTLSHAAEDSPALAATPIIKDEGKPVDTAPANATPPESAEENSGKPKKSAVQDELNIIFEAVVSYIAPVLFWKPFAPAFKIPLVLIVILLGGIYFTFLYRFINFRLFGHSISVLRGRYDDPSEEGEVTHFQALTSALSATVGLGNIAGVALAICTGGPGAIFWMWVVAFFGMSLKFSSCTFAQLYRKVKPDGTILGGPMVYLEEGFKERLPSIAVLGKILGVSFAFFTIWASFGGGNMFQANQTYELLASTSDTLKSWGDSGKYLVGGVLAFFVGIVIMGGIKRIGQVTSKLVPAMCLFYCCTCLYIVLMNFGKIPAVFTSIFSEAFKWKSAYGGFLGVLFWGLRRASFSNEAGLGSAAIAHSAAKTSEPIREGVVAMMGPFIDTICVCTATAFAILMTGAHLDPSLKGMQGVAITAKAFESVATIMPIFLTIAVAIFAYSTVLSWYYYGERATEYLFGVAATKIYRLLYILAIVFGPALSLSKVIDFSDMMLFAMAFPNIIGMIFLSGKVREMAADYLRRLKAGEMKVYK